MKNKIAHLIRTFILPTETFVLNQLTRLDQNNLFDNIVICRTRKDDGINLKYPVHLIATLLNETENKIEYFCYKYLKLLTYRAAARLQKQLHHSEIDLIHIHYLVDARFFLRVYKKLSIPKIVSCYGYDVSSFPKEYLGLGKLYLRPVFKHIDYFLAMSDDMKYDLIRLGCPEDKIIIHYHGINVSKFLSINRKYKQKENYTLLIIASLVEKKGHIFILKALILLKDSYKINLRIAGDGNLLLDLKSFVKDYNLSRNVKFLGHIDNNSDELLDEITKADIFIHPSIISSTGDKEGIPGALVEAMAAALPVISTYHAGIPDIIKDESNGLLANERDYRALASLIEKLILDNELREMLGSNAREFAKKNLDYFQKTKDLEKIYINNI